MRRVCVAAVLALVAASSRLAAQWDAAALDRYIARAVTEWRVPGLAIAIVRNDSIVFAKGYGVREVGKPDRITPNTIFAIGSNSKLFTGVAAGLMVDAGTMRWDAPLTTYIPWFQLSDPVVTRELTLRDALAHRSGLGEAGGAAWYGSDFDRAEVLRRIRHAPVNSSFRSRFEYQNVMYIAAGEAVGAVAGTSWDAVMRTRIFEPLGMRSSSTRIAELPTGGDVANPHQWLGGRAMPIPWRRIDNAGGAGAINSTALDMAQWLRLLLNGGRYADRQIISPAAWREITSPQMIVPGAGDTLHPSTHFNFYGLGVRLTDYLGYRVLWHTGGIDGMRSRVTLVPEKRLGLVILMNTWGRHELHDALSDRVLDLALGDTARRDWSRIALARLEREEARARDAEARASAGRATNTRPSLALDQYAGTYRNVMTPDLVIAENGGVLTARFGSAFTGRVDHWQYDTFRIGFFLPAMARESVLATFVLDARGRVTAVRVEALGEFERAS
jgi:CubicO group peptidase (beta-lactamase class C family)